MAGIDEISTGGAAGALLRPRAGGGGEAFAAKLTQMIRDVNQDQLDAAQKTKELMVDGTGTIHDAVTAISKAEGSFRLLMEARNRALEAFNELLQTRL